MSGGEELVVLSHLRWAYVWQRPQHLISRLARGRRTWFAEEPLATVVGRPTLRTEGAGPVTRAWYEFWGEFRFPIFFDDPEATGYAQELVRLVGPKSGRRIVWLYTPQALDLARALEPDVLVYDVMDDLASFALAPPGLRERQAEALREATLVFTGGRSLQRGVEAQRPDAHLFPSGVEPEHWRVERPPREPGRRPVAGYLGVIDERVDHELVGGLAAALPDWEIRMVGPIHKKISPDIVARGDNITYHGQQPYERLPHIVADFDVALMPFALNDATRSISPTKTLEYLAAGLPVVSTRVPDVVADYDGVLALADDAEAFAAACRAALGRGPDPGAEELVARQTWDAIAARMDELVEGAA